MVSVDRKEKQGSVSVSFVHKLHDCTSQMSKFLDIPANVVPALAQYGLRFQEDLT
jgi:hypothetical protein